MSTTASNLASSGKGADNSLQMNRTVEGVSAALYGLLKKTNKEIVRAGKFICMDKEYSRFENRKGLSSGEGKDTTEDHIRASIPDFYKVYKFIYSLFRRAQIEPECLIAGVVYLEQFLNAGKAKGLIVTGLNWERIAFTTLMIASKAWDDVSCSTKSFAVCSNGTIGLSELCRMERIVLEHLDYRLYLTADTYRVIYYDLKKFWVNLSVDEKGCITAAKREFVDSLEIPSQWGPEFVFGCADQPPSIPGSLSAGAFLSVSAGSSLAQVTTIQTSTPPHQLSDEHKTKESTPIASHTSSSALGIGLGNGLLGRSITTATVSGSASKIAVRH